MRPIYLKMSAFGSYARETEIHFDQMEGVFLITGDTGSGKTTIFDGITYALYGQTSGGRRDGSMMRSQYAPVGTKTFVELEFENRGEIYRVVRSPEYQRESKRKTKDGKPGLTTEKARTELYLPDGTAFSGNRQEINRKIVEILGVDARQFGQIAMIAQGDFLKLLHARSDERKEIFSRIFDTRIFWRVQEELKNRAKQLYILLEDNRKSCLREMEQMEGTGEEATKSLQSLLEAKDKEPDLVRALKTAETLCEADRENYRKSREQSRECGIRTEKQSQKYSLAQDRQKRFLELDKAREQQAVLEQDRELWKQREVQWKLAKKAEIVDPVHQAWEDTKKACEDAEKRLTGLEKWFLENGKRARLIAGQLEDCKHTLQELEKREQPVQNRLRQSLEQYEQLQPHVLEAEKLETDCMEGRKAYQKADAAYRKLAAEYEKVYQAYFQEQAGIMASRLEEGTPCPVCGSTVHPQKAELSVQAPTREQVEELKLQREDAEKRRDQEQKEVVRLSGMLEREQAVIREIRRQMLGNDFLVDQLPDEETADWEKWKEKTQERLESGKRELEKAGENLEHMQMSYEHAVREESQRRGQMEENTVLCEEQRYLLEKRSRQFASAWEKQGFANEQDYMDSRLERKEQDKLERGLGQYRESLMENEQKQKLLVKQLRGVERPSIREIEDEWKRLKQEQQFWERELQKIYSRREKNREAFRKLSQLAGERDLLRSRYEKVSNISRTANGNLSGSVKIDFESYMQRQYFEQMISCANRHLQQMASGQFLLRCRSLEHLSAQGNAGLDLDVYSLVTGKVRDVKTLSGGESFMAALALALGMTDVITRTTGAVRMDTLFIDEGFGSLDENAREQAIRILHGLSGGRRLVGIISHVTELKDQIEHQLVVTKTRSGSYAAWRT